MTYEIRIEKKPKDLNDIFFDRINLDDTMEKIKKIEKTIKKPEIPVSASN